MSQLYVDLDNTLADLVSHYKNVFGVELDIAVYRDHGKDNIDWKMVREYKNFFLDIPPMIDMAELWSYIAPYKPIVLTGIPPVEKGIVEAEQNKRTWVKYNLGKEVEVICVQAKDKYTVCKSGDILIDDWEKYKHKWIEAGGHWITHTSAKNSIKQLQQIELIKL